MKPIRKPRLSPIEQRKQQLAKQIDELRQQAATKTQKSFKTDKGTLSIVSGADLARATAALTFIGCSFSQAVFANTSFPGARLFS
jgi:hypothetical protein